MLNGWWIKIVAKFIFCSKGVGQKKGWRCLEWSMQKYQTRMYAAEQLEKSIVDCAINHKL